MVGQKGPPVTQLTTRLAETPDEFLKEPVMQGEEGIINKKGSVHVGALISDLLYDAGGNFLPQDKIIQFIFTKTPENRNYAGLIMIIIHLLHDRWFLEKKKYSKQIYDLLVNKRIKNLSDLVDYKKFITDPERREELVRIVLNALNLIPEGESKSSAKDRLTTLDSIERDRIVKKSKAAREKARKLREAIARREAEEASSKMSRE